MLKSLGQKISKANLKRTMRYCRKNGFCNTFYAIKERISEKGKAPYVYEKISEKEIQKQKQECAQCANYFFSILVPAYETQEVHLKEMIESVCLQTYPNWELIIADASRGNSVEATVKTYTDKRIRYERLRENKGISDNSNEALKLAKGDYIALLDHDDLLEPHALYLFAKAIKEAKEKGIEPALLYSDEDKTDADAKIFFEPHRKQAFNLDLFLSNNYICHFTLIQAGIIKELRFRPEYDGAQDFDLFLRVVAYLQKEERILHVPTILYHWRCHGGSTAENPESKMYAYEAGRKATEDFCKSQGWKVVVEHTKHLGFYRISYQENIFQARKEIAAIGGPLLRRGKIVGGIRSFDGSLLFSGLSKHFSGYMHRASLQQQAEVLDINAMIVRKECQKYLEEIKKLFGVSDASNDKEDIEKQKEIALEFAKRMKELGYVLYYDPKHQKPNANQAECEER